MSGPPSNGKVPPAKPKPSASAGSGASAGPAKKKASTMSFMPTIPTHSAKVTSSPAAGAGGGQRPVGMRPISTRPAGAPPGQFRNGRGPPGMGGKPGFGKPGFGPRPPTWVPVGSTSISSGAAAASSSAMATDEQKPEPQKRQPKQYHQEDIAPTAQSMQIDPLNLAHPMTLPFLDPIKANPTLKSGGMDVSSKGVLDAAAQAQIQNMSGSVRLMGIQSEISNPANLMFKSEDGDYTGEDQLFFIQLPTAIPLGEVPARPSFAQENTEILGFKGNLTTLNSGKIGKIVVYKSGKVKMRVGDQLFDVSTGMPCNFLQEVVAIDSNKQKLYQLGELQRRMVCYPDIADMLDDSPADPFKMDTS